MFESNEYRRLEVGGAEVIGPRPLPHDPLQLQLPILNKGYADAQIDDYGLNSGNGRQGYPWRPGVSMQIRAKFSHNQDVLKGTAGFGFWNAPFADPTVRWPTLPQAAWFFFGSVPNSLPLAPLPQVGQGWYAATLDAKTRASKLLIPLAPFILIGNQFKSLRQAIWPKVQARLGISYAQIPESMAAWHSYRLDWLADGCQFWIDGRLILQTSHTPQGPLGFVCWLDNQYMCVTPRGRFGWGTLAINQPQRLEISHLEITKTSSTVA